MFFRRKSIEEIQRELYKNTKLVIHGEAHYDSKIQPPLTPLSTYFLLSFPSLLSGFLPWERPLREPYFDSFLTQKMADPN